MLEEVSKNIAFQRESRMIPLTITDTIQHKNYFTLNPILPNPASSNSRQGFL